MDGRCGMDFTRKQRPEDELPEPYKTWYKSQKDLQNAFREEHRRQREHREEKQRERKSRWFEDFFFNAGPREFPVSEEEVSYDDPFKVLGLKRSASDEDIKTKYRELILIHHPDKSGGDHEEFIRIQEAYETLK